MRTLAYPTLLALPITPYFLVGWTDIRNFLLGMLTGVVLILLFIALMLVTGRKNKRKIIQSKEKPLDERSIDDMIIAKQNELVDTVRYTDNAYFRVAFDLSMELVQEIAQHYFPDSKYPMYELSLEELMDLAGYITKRINGLLDTRFLRHFKNYRISTIVNILNKKKAIDNSKLMKLSRKYKISKIYSVGRTVVNVANPIFWFRKLAIKPSVTLVTKEVCKYIIEIFGEETNKVYSKKLFELPDDEEKLEKDIDNMIEEEIEEPKQE